VLRLLLMILLIMLVLGAFPHGRTAMHGLLPSGVLADLSDCSGDFPGRRRRAHRTRSELRTMPPFGVRRIASGRIPFTVKEERGAQDMFLAHRADHIQEEDRMNPLELWPGGSVAACGLLASSSYAQPNATAGTSRPASPQDSNSNDIQREVMHELRMLPYYSGLMT